MKYLMQQEISYWVLQNGTKVTHSDMNGHEKTERLIELIKATPHGTKTLGDVLDSLYIENVMVKHLLENGVIVPPCKVGATVYEIQPLRNRIQPYEVITVKYNGHFWYMLWKLKNDEGIYGNLEGFVDTEIGKTVFLTKEEAEAKLKEGVK